MKKQPFAPFFKDKTVTLMGLGLLGRGVGDAAFLAEHCKKVYVTDQKTEEELRPSLEALKDHKNIEFFLGGHDEKIFSGVDFIIKAAGVRLDNPYIERAKKNNIPVYMSTALFSHLAPIKTIGVTGTRGKTTVVYMIADILKRAGKNALLGGNIRGVSTLARLPDADQFDMALLELDSWQLQGFDSLNISPNIGVFTTFYPDHMNYYDGDMDRYMRDKTAIFRHQKEGDTFITSEEVAKLIDKNKRPPNQIIAQPLPPSFNMKIPGAHNLLNAGLAKAVGKTCGIDEKTIDEALRNFESVEGRLQFVGAWKDRNIYNDNNATTQEATLAALNSFPPATIVLIFGGSDKGLPFDRLLAHITNNNIRCVLLKGTGSDRVLKKKPTFPVAASMSEAVKFAIDQSKPGDNIILSPAFASFGMFKNEYDRNDQFLSEIETLIAGSKG
jgi:UDP-N-acetylmuramoylalanine--D-glutamate ligase